MGLLRWMANTVEQRALVPLRARQRTETALYARLVKLREYLIEHALIHEGPDDGTTYRQLVLEDLIELKRSTIRVARGVAADVRWIAGGIRQLPSALLKKRDPEDQMRQLVQEELEFRAAKESLKRTLRVEASRMRPLASARMRALREAMTELRKGYDEERNAPDGLEELRELREAADALIATSKLAGSQRIDRIRPLVEKGIGVVHSFTADARRRRAADTAPEQQQAPQAQQQIVPPPPPPATPAPPPPPSAAPPPSSAP